MTGLVKDILARRELLSLLVVRNIKIRYKESVLGFLWTLLGPIFLIVIYAIFLKIMRIQTSMTTLVSGIFVWQYLAMCLGDSSFAIIGNANLVKKACFPRVLLPLSIVFANFVNFLLSVLVMFAYLLVFEPHIGSLGLLPVAMLVHLALCAGVSLALCALNVFFRDVQHLTGIVTMAWFFVSPVVYDLSMITPLTDKYPVLGPMYFLNPMAGIVSLYRTALVGDPLPAFPLLATSGAVAIVVFVGGVFIFQRLQPKFADEL
jgi:ABC-type polysaccharide/polyol phosphate export permease